MEWPVQPFHIRNIPLSTVYSSAQAVQIRESTHYITRGVIDLAVDKLFDTADETELMAFLLPAACSNAATQQHHY